MFEIPLLVVLIILSAFFSGVEAAFISLSKIKIRQMIEKNLDGAFLVQKLKDKPHTLLSTLLVGNNLVNIGASALATGIVLEKLPAAQASSAVAISTGIMTLLILTFGEIIPKNIAINHNKFIALHSARFVNALSYILYPIIKFFDFISRGSTKIFGEPKKESMFSEEEIKSIVSMGEEVGTIEPEEKKMIHNVFKFDHTDVYDIMTPRTVIVAIEDNKNIKDALNLFIKSGHSRIPVYKDNIDRITGVLFIKDILPLIKKGQMDASITKVMTKPMFIPETKIVDEMLDDFKEKRAHLAVVIDEHGGVSGVVTVEDIVEEIVGEIYDEADAKRVSIKKISPTVFQIRGETSLEEVNEELGLNLHDEEFDTISGIVLHNLGRLPEKGESVKLKGGIKITVSKIDEQRIVQVRLEK